MRAEGVPGRLPAPPASAPLPSGTNSGSLLNLATKSTLLRTLSILLSFRLKIFLVGLRSSVLSSSGRRKESAGRFRMP